MSSTVCWSVKGGSGTSTVAASLAMLERGGSLLVDLCGDSAALFGLDTAAAVGLSEWFASNAAAASLSTLCVPVGNNDALLLPCTTRLAYSDDVNAERYGELNSWLREQSAARPVIVDAGTASEPVVASLLADVSNRSILVLRPCFLAIRRAVSLSVRVDGIVMVREEGRSLSNTDIEAATGVPVVAEVMIDPAIARAIDAGLLNTRLPRLLRRSLRVLIESNAENRPVSNDRRNVA